MVDENEDINNNIYEEETKEPSKIEVVEGNGNLNISPVYDHLEIETPKQKENKTIVIPEIKNVKNAKKASSSSSSEEEE